MRLLVTAVGTAGDVRPAVALALKARDAGDAVALCIPPNFLEWVRGLGFEATAVGIAMRRRASHGTGSTQGGSQPPQAAPNDLVADQFRAVGAAAVRCDVVVGAGSHQYAAPSIAESRGIPYVNAVFAPTALPSPEHPPPPAPGDAWTVGTEAENLAHWEADARAWNLRALDRVNAGRDDLGLAPIVDVRGHLRTSRPWLAADRLLAPAPWTPGVQVRQTGAWMLNAPNDLPPELEAFLLAGDAPVYAGFGSMPVPAQTAGALVDAARAIGCRVIVSRGWAGLALGTHSDPDCIAIGDVEHAALFPRLAAVVHHGGAGTTTSAAKAGLPQVIAPLFADQFYWAQQVERLALGTSVNAITSDALLTGLQTAMDPEVAERCRDIASSIDDDGAATAVQALHEL